MTQSRIPQLKATSTRGIGEWFKAMAASGLLFHPDDDPANIIRVDDNESVFATDEAVEVRRIVDRMFVAKGDRVYDIALPVFHRALGITIRS